jgi:cellulase/cellobiase CelA1
LLIRNRTAANAAPLAAMRKPNQSRTIIPNAAPDIGPSSSSSSSSSNVSQKIIYTTPLGATIKPKAAATRRPAAPISANASAALDSFLADIEGL